MTKKMSAQLELFAPSLRPIEAEWLTGMLPDRSGTSAYVILIRSPNDPKRAPRQRGSDKAPHLTLRRQSMPKWRDAIAALLDDGRAMTFNAICVQLCGLTADICPRVPQSTG